MKKILLAILLGMVSLSANAYMEYDVPYDTTTPSFRFDVIDQGEYLESQTSTFQIPYDYIVPILESAYNWKDILNLNTPNTAEYIYKSDNVLNAFAVSPYVKYKDGGVLQPYKVTAANAALHGWVIDDPAQDVGDIHATITVGTGLDEVWTGWQTYTGKHALYHGELPDLYAVMNHEIMHSIGISSGAEQFHKADPTPDNKYYFSSSLSDPLSIYDKSMRIYTGSAPVHYDSAFLLKEFGPNQKMDDTHSLEYVPIGTEDGQYNVRQYSPYLVGKNVITVLGGNSNYNTARENIIANGGLLNYSSSYYKYSEPETTVYPTVYGMPVHPYDDDTSYDLSHLELRNSYMSHQDFRNWLIPMEAELAVLKDCGFTEIDLRRHFGRSYYLDGNGTSSDPIEYSDGFGEWNGVSYSATEPSMVDQAVGIHIYGSNNYIRQKDNDILIGKVGEEDGEGAFGVRIDGVQNTYTLASNANIYTNGKENIGIGVTWGKNHEVNISSGSRVVAAGEDGIAVSFDFGSNLFGRAANEFIKGSYINHYKMSSSTETEHTVDPENDGPLVTAFNVNGILEGSKAAIYIADNAYVKTMNINNGSKISGNIISEWNSESSMGIAAVQEPTTKYTALNFDGTVDMKGNITGDNDIQNTLNMQNTGTLNFSGQEINVNTLNNDGTINIIGETTISTVSGAITQTTPGTINVTAPDSALRLGYNVTSVENTLNFDGTTLDTMNGSVGTLNLSQTNFSGNNRMNVDIDLASSEADTLHFATASDLSIDADASIQIANVNLINTNKAYTTDEYYIQFISPEDNNQKLLTHLDMGNIENIMTPIFKYNLGYVEDGTQGGFSFSRGSSSDYNSYNPSVLASPVAAQVGGYLTLLNSYDEAFYNMDMYMLMTKEQRQALKLKNKYATSDSSLIYNSTLLRQENTEGWFRPYVTFEKVGLKNGPKVENTAYGTYVGGESKMYNLGHGWDGMLGAYVGYNGSHQNYDGVSIYQNGGTLGVTGMVYKGNFFTGLTVNAGANAGEARTMYGQDNFSMLMAGIASKTGYNWELAKGKFIIQPNWLMSYSFVNTFDYTNAAGVRINSDPLNAIQLQPELKFIGNLKNGWQPYASIAMVWNILDNTKFKANDITMPEMSIKPYVKYGIGIRKIWGERFTGFFQTYFTNGGRNGVGLSAGFTWAIGKSNKQK